DLFDWFFEAACPVSLEEDPPILWQFPPDFKEQEVERVVPKFCFPFDVEREPPNPAVQHFTFALTDLAGNRRFGFCRLRAGAQSCLCVLSHLPWFEVFYKILNAVGDLLAQNQVSEAEEFLQHLQQHPHPGSRSSRGPDLVSSITSELRVLPPALGDNKLLSCFVAPDSDRLPSIPENRNLTELVVAVTDQNIIRVFAALLAERRVLFIASKLSTLTSCVHASCALLYPMRWEHVLIPTLPPHLLDYCCAPMPYLIGVHASLTERVHEKGLEDVVVLNIDSNTLETPFDDVQALPPDVVSLLRLRLRKVALSSGEGVSRLFLKAQALLFGGYRDALVCTPDQPVTFCEEAFLGQKAGAPLQAFHKRAVHLQLFRQFIETRLEKLNSGEGFSDQFEQEITCCGVSSGVLRSYQLWADNLKKGGGALLHSVKAKTQPAVRNMCRSVRLGCLAKSGLKGMQSLLMIKDGDSNLQRGGSLRTPSLVSRSDRLQQRLPISQHFGQNRPLRPNRRLRLEEGPSEPLGKRNPSLSPEDTQGPWLEETLDSSFLGSGEELDLLSEILDSLSTETKTVGSLRPSQSLDCCHRGDLDDCFSLPDTPGRSPWEPEEEQERPLVSQPQSLPTDLSSLRDTPSLHATSYSQDFHFQKSSASPSASSDPSSQADPKSSPTQPDSRISHSPTQLSPPENPQLLAPPKSNSDTAQTLQSTQSLSHPNSPVNPRNQPPQVSISRAQVQTLRDPEAPSFCTSPTSNWQEPQARRTRVADLKKYFE
uniref:DENN domain containing 1C n=1 Tax=Nannospalax galili TaxID=1026970 RepID=A0A8C6R5U1_NANGA